MAELFTAKCRQLVEISKAVDLDRFVINAAFTLSDVLRMGARRIIFALNKKEF